MFKLAQRIAAGAIVLSSLAAPAVPARGESTSTDATLDRAQRLARHGETHAAWSIARTAPAGEDRVFRLDVRLLTEMERYEEADSLLAHHTPLVVEHDVVRHYLQRARLNYLAGRYRVASDMIAEIDSIENDVYSGYRDYIGMEVDLALDRPGDAVVRGERVLRRGVEPPLSSLIDDAYTFFNASCVW